MAKYVCTVCGYEYDEAAGDPDNGCPGRLHLPALRRGEGRFRQAGLRYGASAFCGGFALFQGKFCARMIEYARGV